MSGNLQRDASRILATAWLGLAGCTILGGLIGGRLAHHLTSPKEGMS